MSGEGGDMGGGAGGGGKGSSDGGGGKGSGGDSSGFGSGGGGDTADYGYAPPVGGVSPDVYQSNYQQGGDTADYGGGASSYAPTGGGGGGSLDSFVNDPSGGNLTGPGPVGGGTGMPGSTGNDFSFDNSQYLSGLDQYAGAPVGAGGTSSVFDTGSSPVSYTNGPDQSAFAATTGGQAAAPSGTSAGGIAAPAGVSGNPDASSLTDLSSVNRKSAGGGGGASQSSGILDSIGIGKNNLASSAVAGVGLLNNMINGNKAPAQSGALTANATTATHAGTQQIDAGTALQQWQTTGTLPASYESQVQRAAQDAKTRAISNAAQQGLPTDPTQNTALAQQLNAIDAAIPGQREQIAAQLAQSGQQMINAGLQATGVSSSVYQTLANLENQQNQQRGAAIANFASALNGGGNRGLTLKVA